MMVPPKIASPDQILDAPLVAAIHDFWFLNANSETIDSRDIRQWNVPTHANGNLHWVVVGSQVWVAPAQVFNRAAIALASHRVEDETAATSQAALVDMQASGPRDGSHFC